MSCKYILEDGIYYMECDGKKIPVDIDAPPKFKGNVMNVIDKIASEILAKMERYDVTGMQLQEILKQVKSQYGIDPMKDAIYRAYMIYQDDRSNKFHYFTVFKDDQDVFIGTNVFGRIGYKGRIEEIMKSTDEKEVMNAVQKKMRSKLRKYKMVEEKKASLKIATRLFIQIVE